MDKILILILSIITSFISYFFGKLKKENEIKKDNERTKKLFKSNNVDNIDVVINKLSNNKF